MNSLLVSDAVVNGAICLPRAMISGPTCTILRLEGSPQEIGRAQAAFILSNETFANTASLRNWKANLGKPPHSDSLAEAVEWWNADLLDEISTAAEAIGVTVAAILDSHLPRTTGDGPDESGCTMVGIADGGMAVAAAGCAIVGRNFDLGYSRADVRILPTHPERGLASFGCGGWFGRFDGMNESGLVATMAIVETRRTTPAEPGAIPPTLVIRTLLDRAGTPREALSLIRRIPAWSPTNYLIAGPFDPPVVVERGPGQFRMRSPCGRLVAATNHFLGTDDARRASLYRYEVATSRDAARLATAPGMMSLLHEAADPRLTRWTEVFVPADRTVHFSGGYGASFLKFKVTAAAEAAGGRGAVAGPLPYRTDDVPV